MSEYIYQNETYEIIGICMEVHKVLGHGFREVAYKDAIEIEASLRNVAFCREKEFCINYKDHILKRRFNADFVVFDKIILEVKAAEGGLAEDNISQTLNYLKASGCKVGLIANFGRSKLEYKRLVF
jgi:GxxExxY protein